MPAELADDINFITTARGGTQALAARDKEVEGAFDLGASEWRLFLLIASALQTGQFNRTNLDEQIKSREKRRRPV
jgi:hypothetical protein